MSVQALPPDGISSVAPKDQRVQIVLHLIGRGLDISLVEASIVVRC